MVRGRAFAISGTVHAFVLGWVAFGPATRMPPPPASLYDREIRPNEKRLVWYDFSQRLPEVAPAESRQPPRPARARIKLDQTLVAGTRDNLRPPQLIWMPAPEIAPSKPLPLPNVLDVQRAARPVREFAAPAKSLPAPAPVLLPESPRPGTLEARALPLAIPVPKPRPRAFIPPPESRPQASAPLAVPAAPDIAGTVKATAAPIAVPVPKPQPRAFIPPPESRPQASAPLMVPAAPDIAATVKAAAAPIVVPVPKPQPRAFVPPESRPQASAPLMVPAAPDIAATVKATAAPIAVPVPKPQPREFTPPTAARRAAPAPVLDSSAPDIAPATAAPAQASLAIVGLDPAKITEFPPPPGSRQAGFSGAPQPHPSSEDSGGAAKPTIVVPGLLARGGETEARPMLVAALPPTSRERLAASVRIAPRPADPPSETHATRVESAPDPMLDGRTIYMLAIQMPNVTSYMGSWIVWFAERDPAAPGPAPEIKPPLPLHKVDPKYIAAAAAERVEGKVRLAAVIRKDGRVDAVTLLRHLDERLDRSAAEALAKWEFEPAFRAGRPVDVDAVFEIPFNLAPKISK